MKVLFPSPVGTLGGAERVLLTAVAGLESTEFDPHVLLMADGPLAAEARAAGAGVTVLPMPAAVLALGDSQLRTEGRVRGKVRLLARALLAAPAGLGYAAELRRAVRRLRPNLVHSNGIKTHLLSRVAVPRGVPVVWHVHDFVSLRPAAAGALRRAAGRVRAAVAISDAVAADVRRVLPAVPVFPVPNAVDLARFSPAGEAADLDRLAGVPPAAPGTVRVGLVATYARWKGHRTFLDAAAELPDEPVRFYVVGGAAYHTAAQFTEAELRAAATERGLGDRVGFVPFQPNPAGVYRALDVVVHASTLPEPFGLTVAEGMACGRAVVVSAAGGAAELFTDGADALGVPPGDAAGLAAAVRRLAADPDLRARLGANARTTAEAQYDAARYGPQLASVYRQVLGGLPTSR